MKEVLTTGKAAALLGVSSRAVASWIDKGHLKGWRQRTIEGHPKGDRRTTWTDVVKYMHANNYPSDYIERVFANA